MQESRALRYLITYATWAYMDVLLKPQVVKETDILSIARKYYQNFDKVFTLDFFIREMRRYRQQDVEVRGRGMVQAYHVARGLISDPQYHFNKFLRTSVNVPNQTIFIVVRSTSLKSMFMQYPPFSFAGEKAHWKQGGT